MLISGEVQSALPSPPPASPGPDSLRDSEWFHGQISRAEAELLLEDEGDFLVRESKDPAGAVCPVRGTERPSTTPAVG